MLKFHCVFVGSINPFEALGRDGVMELMAMIWVYVALNLKEMDIASRLFCFGKYYL